MLVTAGKVLQATVAGWYVWTSLQSAKTYSLSVSQQSVTTNLHLEWHGAQWRHTRRVHEIFHHDRYHVGARAQSAIIRPPNCLPRDDAGAKQQRLHLVES